MRSACVSPATKVSSPSPDAIVCVEAAPASGHPEQPPVLRTSPVVAVTLTSDDQVTACAVDEGVAAGGVVVGGSVGAVGAGAGAGAGAAGVVDVEAAENDGTRTRNASRRPEPALAVQMKY